MGINQWRVEVKQGAGGNIKVYTCLKSAEWLSYRDENDPCKNPEDGSTAVRSCSLSHFFFVFVRLSYSAVVAFVISSRSSLPTGCPILMLR